MTTRQISRVILAVGALAAPVMAQPAAYQVTLDISSDVDHVFVYADEFNGQVYAWDLFPAAFGTVHAGRTTLRLGTRDIRVWAILGTRGGSAAMAGINDSLPSLPDGQPFESVFPGNSEATVVSNVTGLYVNGAYNVPQAYFLTEFVLAQEDTLKTDFPTGSLHVYTFGGGGVNIGTATFALVPAVCYANCDGNTTPPVLNVNDFVCFQSRYAAGDTYANCDGSTTPPVLNVNDFVCFQTRFAAGCP